MSTILDVKVSGRHFDEYLAIVKSCPQRRWNSEKKIWEVTMDEETADILEGIPSLLPVVMEWRESQARAQAAKEIADTQLSIKAMKLKEEYPFLFDYQAVGAQFMIDRKKSLNADEVGTGKTVCCMPLIDKVIKEDNGRILVLCPSAIAKQWQSEINRFLRHNSCVVVKMTKAKRLQRINDQKNRIVITTYESFRNDHTDVEMNFECIITDEASKYKNKTAKIYKVLQGLAKNVEYFVALSGTPIENGLENFFNILNVTTPGFMTRKQFDSTFVEWTYNGFGHVPTGYKNLSKFLHIVSEYMIRRRKIDVAKDMPTLTVQNRIIELTPAQIKYAAAIRDYAASHDAMGTLVLLNMVGDDVNLIDGSMSATALELRESGALPSMTKVDTSNKIDELYTLLDELGQKQVIIFTQYSSMARIINQELTKNGYKCICLTGEDKQDVRMKGIEDMREGKAQVLVATDIFGYGVNLQFINNLINFEIPYNPAKLTQRYGRIHRQGSNEPKLVINLLSEDIDERIWGVVSKKQDLFDAVVDGQIISDESIRAQILQKLI